MTNREKYAEQIIEAIMSHVTFGLNSSSGEIEDCYEISCKNCLFGKCDGVPCNVKRKEWLNKEYKEKPKISKKDKMFLECLKPVYKYIYRDTDGILAIKVDKQSIARYLGSGFTFIFDVKLPMVKWEDEEPWKIEDLKNLEVVEEYEDN